ncbi:MAG: hypothetical protein ACQEXJ_18950 [Myxococcota bacterium]
MGAVAEGAGLFWGRRWKPLRDDPHVQVLARSVQNNAGDVGVLRRDHDTPARDVDGLGKRVSHVETDALRVYREGADRIAETLERFGRDRRRTS